MDLDTLVIGGGAAGLCAAYYRQAAKQSGDVLLIDSGDQPGGHMKTDVVDGFTCDWGPNGFLDREPLTLEWVDALGLTPDLVQAQEAAARRFIVRGGQLVELVPPPKFMLAPILSIPGRLRMMMEPLIAQRVSDQPESIWDFAARRIGSEAADTLVGPMVSGVFGGDAKQLSLAHCFPRMAAMERDHGSLFKAMRARSKSTTAAMGPGGTLTSFEGGVATLADKASAALGESLRSGESVQSLRREGDTFIAETSNGTYRARKCIIATPPTPAATMISDLAPDAARAIASISCCNIAVVCTGYTNPQDARVDGFGFLVPRFEKRRALGCIWTSSVFPHEAREGGVLLRTMIGGATDPDAVNLSDEELLDIVATEVGPLVNINESPDITRIFRHRNAIPQYGLDHGTVLQATERAEQAHPGLAFAGNGYRGVGLNDCVVSAHRALKIIEESTA